LDANGIPARVRTLEAEVVNVKKNIIDLTKTNRAEHKEVRDALAKMQGMGWVILGGVISGVVLMVIGLLGGIPH
jgi:hypothetical protein